MNKAEIWNLFDEIVQYYPTFTGDDEKVAAWHKVLVNMPFVLATENLKQHVMTEKWLPTIAEIRYGYEEPLSKIVPSVEETHESFKQLEEWRAKAVPMPDHLKKEMNRLVRGSRHPNS